MDLAEFDFILAFHPFRNCCYQRASEVSFVCSVLESRLEHAEFAASLTHKASMIHYLILLVQNRAEMESCGCISALSPFQLPISKCRKIHLLFYMRKRPRWPSYSHLI